MRVHRTRAAVAGALSAAVLVGFPVAMAGPAVGAQHPGTMLDDPLPGDGAPTPAAEDFDAAIELEVVDAPPEPTQLDDALALDDPPSAGDVTEPALVVQNTANDATEPAFGTAAVDLERNEAPAASDDAPVPDGPVQGEAETEDVDDQPAAPIGGFDDDIDDSGDDDRRAGNSARSGSGNASGNGDGAAQRSAGTDAVTTVDGVTPVQAATPAATEDLPESGASTTALLQTALALIGGGLLVRGVGRHRRSPTSRRARRAALGI